MDHGSHPQHRMKGHNYPPVGMVCSICKGCSQRPTMEEEKGTLWYTCTQEICNYMLCWKCFEIDEKLLDTPEIIIRNPYLSYDETSVKLRTRPRDDAHPLSPLSPSQLMIAVSFCVNGPKDREQKYYRLKSGGWVNAAYVVPVDLLPNAAGVVPVDLLPKHIGWLARTHVCAHEGQKNIKMPLDELLACIDESFRLMDKSARIMDESFRLMDEICPYGPLMASLTLFPVMQYSENVLTIPEVERTSYIRAAQGFVHYIFYFALEKIYGWIQNADCRMNIRALAIHMELLAKSICVVRDFALSLIVKLPVEFGPLLIQTARVAVALMPYLECGTPPLAPDMSAIRAPSVVDRPTELTEEKMRLYSCCFSMLESIGRVLQHTAHFTYNINDIRPLREAVSLAPNSEILARTLCQVATSAIERTPSLQRKIHDLDVLEVALLLAKKETCAESQMAVCKLISAIAHKSPRNISQIAMFAIPVLCQMLSVAWNSVVVCAVFDSFVELAFNDPRVDSSYGDDIDDEEAFAFPICSGTLHPEGSPYQLMTVYGMDTCRVAVCEYCRVHHPPENRVPVSAPQFAFFHCQCVHCQHDTIEETLPPPNVPTTPAIQEMMKRGIVRTILSYLRRGETSVVNAIGRLSLKIALPVEVTLALYRSLLNQNILSCSDAALAVAAQSHLPAVKEMRRDFPSAPISLYLSNQWSAKVQPDVLHMTPGQFSQSDEDGLSPSPDLFQRKSDGYHAQRVTTSTRIDLFTVPQKMYLDDVL